MSARQTGLRGAALALCAGLWSSCAGTRAEAKPAATPADTGASSSAAVAPRAKLPEPDWLPSEAREMLSARMQRHGEEMMLLLVSVMTLSHDDTMQLAEEVAAEPRLGRPSPGETDTINARLPARFFELQDQLAERAHAVAAAAKANDDARIVRAYGQLAETCVSCHTVYLDPESTFDMPGD
jgi:hypothetical protein